MKEKFIMRFFQQGLALFLSWCLILVGIPNGFAQTEAPTAQAPPQAEQKSSQQLQQLVAPIALYPDALIAQILPAATYPDQGVEAGEGMEQNKGPQGNQLTTER